ncbi:hypothetical protein LCGC14_2564740, partial [marine sediment metagenome]
MGKNKTKTCTKCKIEKKHGDFGRDQRRKDGLQSHCRCCMRNAHRLWYKEKGEKYYKEFRQRRERKKYSCKSSKAYRNKYPEKCKARDLLKYAVRSGKIKKKPCPCGKTKVQGHHEDYSKPLDVEWL